ncbi:MAG: CHC2 zinc finger domain-containing protein [Candidatus Acidiferrales bacterium]
MRFSQKLPEKASSKISSPLSARAVKADADFFAIVSRYTRLRQSGRQFVGLCPFHSETHPSFFVDPVRKIFFCHGCQAGGDAFDFIMRVEDCAFPEALRIVGGLARVSGSRSEPRSDTRVRGAFFAPLIGREAPDSHSPSTEHARLVARLDATQARLAAIRAANDAASVEFATACESGAAFGFPYLLEESK